MTKTNTVGQNNSDIFNLKKNAFLNDLSQKVMFYIKKSIEIFEKCAIFRLVASKVCFNYFICVFKRLQEL